MIPKETLDRIVESSRIDDVVGDFVSLKKRGANLLGLCPFHNEKTPSFTVSPAKGIYKCFGCGKAGNSVRFMMDHEQFTYPEALKYLAKKYNIEVEEKALSPDQIKQAGEKESMYIVSQFAADYFQENLHNSKEGKAIGLSYFKERGFNTAIIDKFKLGYSSDEWSAFTKEAISKAYKVEYLEKTGLTILKGEKQFDRFRGRVMFPIQNISGRVIGFGGRTLKQDKKEAKYLNSPESVIYHKSNVLYGLNLAKKSIVEKDNCFLVEGYTDVISFHQNEIENVVASSGTSLTTEQIKLIKRYTNNVTILFDGDVAGIKASFRGIDMILQEGLNVKVIAFPEGEDPDSFAQKSSNSDLVDFLQKEANDFIQFKTKLLLDETNNDPIKKAELIKEIVKSISLIPDAISRSVYIQSCSALLDIAEETLMSELNKLRGKKAVNDAKNEAQFFEEISKDISSKEKPETRVQLVEYQEKEIIRVLVKYGNEKITIPISDEEKQETVVAPFVINETERDSLKFSNAIYQKIYDWSKNQVNAGSELNVESLVSSDDAKISELVIEMMMEKYSLSGNWLEHNIHVELEEKHVPRVVHKSVCSWRLSKISEMIEDLQKRLIDNSDYEQIIEQIEALRIAKKVLAAELGRVILGK